jgi:uncharacterized protein (TIGR02231 family)
MRNVFYGICQGFHLNENKIFMNYRLLIFAVLVFSSDLFGQELKPVDSKITNVTVFLNRAQITREARTRLESGKTHVVIKGLTSQLDPQSIQVEGKGAFTILGISHQQNYLSELNLPKGLIILRDSVELLQRQLTLETTQKEILTKEEQMLLSNQRIGGTNQNLTVAELKAMADFFRARLRDIATEKIKEDVLIKKLNDRIQKVQRQMAEQNELYSRNTSEVVVAVSADAPTSVELTLNYVVNNAGWTAEYDLRATNAKSPVQLNYKANVFQATGEDWKNVHLKLSTANPSLGGLKPELNPWYLSFYEPAQLQEVVRTSRYKADRPAPAARAQDASKEYEEVAGPAETTSQYVSTVQTSLNTEFDISLPYTVSSSNKPTTVDIRNHELKATYLYSVAPKIDGDAFLMARATGWEDFSLLPGEANVFFEGTFVGKSFIDPNSVRDTLAISLGRDKRIVVKREKLKDFSSRKLIGANQRDSYAYEISVRNTKNEPITLMIEDQLPISQDSQIEVTPIDTGTANYNKINGKLTWLVTIAPNETKKVGYKFEIKYPKGRTVTGL